MNSQTNYNPLLGNGEPRQYFNQDVGPLTDRKEFTLDSGLESESQYADLIAQSRAQIFSEPRI